MTCRPTGRHRGQVPSPAAAVLSWAAAAGRFRGTTAGMATCDSGVGQEAPVSDPQGSDRIQQDIPTASGTGDNSSTGSGFDDVPLTADEAIERDAAAGDDLPARADSDVARARTDGPSGEVR